MVGIHNSKDKQIEAHLFLSILAFHVVHLIRSKLGAKQIHKNWATLKVKLSEHLRVTTVVSQNKTHGILLKQDQDLKPFQRQIFKAMGLKPEQNTQRVKVKRPKKKSPKCKNTTENNSFSNLLKIAHGFSAKKSTTMSNLRNVVNQPSLSSTGT